ncbi:pleckstrin homology domain-containing family A member 6 isoform X3 [Kryptolebias marmoratus]|uniref:pleckstrin homology domain-containing family A member 6 isoform X3 n=1 Tax=Kryptolebias marmoratus TaxID=37003 RepID=UPI0007F92E3C|nr:pleckstrin homology domain-containing family A member 6 isoform X3 [Kryptolebias marmoratus]
MNGKVKAAAAAVKISYSRSASMVSDLSPEAQTYSWMFRTPRKVAVFGKRSNSMRRNPKAEVTKQGWLYKQASSGVKQWNKRWFVLTDRCLFYYKDEKEDTVLGSLPLLGFRIGGVEPSDNITRRFAFKAKHSGTRTYYFSADSHEEQEDWIRTMSEAAEVTAQPTTQRKNPETDDLKNPHPVTKTPDPKTQQNSLMQTHTEPDNDLHPHPNMNKCDSPLTEPPYSLGTDQDGNMNDRRQGEAAKAGEDGVRLHHPNNWGNRKPPISKTQNTSSKPVSSRSGHHAFQGHLEEGVGPTHEPKMQQENVVLRRGFVPRTTPERKAQRKSSMAQLQQWVNQRRGMSSQEDLNSLSHYYPVSRGVSVENYRHSLGSQYADKYPLYPAGVRPDSMSSVSPMMGYDRRWTLERRSLRDGPQHYGGMEPSMRRLSIQPRSRSVPRSPSLSSGGPYSPIPPSFPSPARSPSMYFDRFPGRTREDMIYADPFSYGLRQSISSPKYMYPGERRSLSRGLYHHSYPVSPSIHIPTEDILDLQLQRNLDYLDQQIPPFHDVYSRELHPTLKLNEIETTKLLGRLCELSRMLKEHEAVIHRLRIEKDSLEDELVAIHQEMEIYHSQPLIMDKLQLRKESQQNQLINIRGELSQASSALTTVRMEFEALEDEANAIHEDLWEQLNAGGQSELVHRHIQKEFWRVQDTLEGLHKNHSSRGTDTAKHRVTSAASGSFATNSPASPLSSVSLTSPLRPYSPMPGSQPPSHKQLGSEESVPPRPPLPKSYCPLESSPTFSPSVPPMPYDSIPWLCNLDNSDSYCEDLNIMKTNIISVKQPNPEDVRDVQDQFQDKQSSANKVGIVPPRTKSPNEESHGSSAEVSRQISKERPKSAVFSAEIKSKMSVEEQNERIRRNKSSSVTDKRRSLNFSGGQSPANYRVVRRRLTAHEIDIKDLEAAVRGEGQESPSEEIARLRRLQMDPEHCDISRELIAPNNDGIPDHFLDLEDDTPLSPEEQKEKQKKLDRIKTLIAKSNLQNLVPATGGPVEGGPSATSQHQLQEQEKRIEMSCALAAEASRRSRLISAQCASSPPTSPSSHVPTSSSADFSNSAHIMKV